MEPTDMPTSVTTPADPPHDNIGSGWRRHPAVRSGTQLTLGERAADRMRNSMGSWGFVFCASIFLAGWMLYNRSNGFDPYPFILLNLVLSCVAAMQGAILLIAARRSDQIASELALNDYHTNLQAAEMIKHIAALTEQIREHIAKEHPEADAEPSV